LEILLTDIKSVFSQIHNLVQSYESFISSTKDNRESTETFYENCLHSLNTIRSNLEDCFKGKSNPVISDFLENELGPMFADLGEALTQKNFKNFANLDKGMHDLTIFPRKLLRLIRLNYSAEESNQLHTSKKKKNIRHSHSVTNNREKEGLESRKMDADDVETSPTQTRRKLTRPRRPSLQNQNAEETPPPPNEKKPDNPPPCNHNSLQKFPTTDQSSINKGKTLQSNDHGQLNTENPFFGKWECKLCDTWNAEDKPQCVNCKTEKFRTRRSN